MSTSPPPAQTLGIALYWFAQAVRKPAEAETAAQLEIAVKDVTVEGSGDGPADDEKDYNSSDYTNGSTNGSSVDGDILDALDGGANEVAAPATGSYARRSPQGYHWVY